MGISPRARFIMSSCAVIIVLVAVIVGLTLGLRTSPPENGGSPPEFTLPPVTDASPTSDVDPAFPPSELKKFRFAAVASDATLCAQIGTDIMGRKGGNAVDAAIAGMICVGAVNSQSTGIGGGHFSLIYASPRGGGEKEVVAIMSRETAPAAADRDMFVNGTESSTRGGKASGVPGEVKGFYEAWSRYGNVPWDELWLPTIRLLTEGFPVGRHLANAAQQNTAIIKESPTLSEVYLRDDGEVVEEGDIIKDATLAQTMQRIALDPHTFYNGTLAAAIVDDLNEADGIITLEDLRNYETKIKSATEIRLNNGGYTLYGAPPPSSGVVLQHIMQILDGFNLSPSDINRSTHQRSLTYHRVIEAFKFAYGKRSALGDEDYVDVEELVRNMTSADYANYIRSRIDDNQTYNVSYYDPAFEGFTDQGTAHLSALDQYGNAVALTSTINLYFGSKVRGSRTGILFNNEMDDFSTPGTENSFGLPASPSNFIEPGKMPMSSMAPAIFVTDDGTPAFITGGSGGTRITSQIAAVAINNLWLGDDLKEATDRSRYHHQLVPHRVDYESDMEESLLDDLIEKGHVINEYSTYLAVIGSIRSKCNECAPNCLNEYCIEAVADGRKGGEPDGF